MWGLDDTPIQSGGLVDDDLVDNKEKWKPLKKLS